MSSHLSLCQSSVSFSVSFGDHLKDKQFYRENPIHPARRDYEFIEYLRKSMANQPDPSERNKLLQEIQFHEAERDYFTQPLRHINHLIQFDKNPNAELKEARWELYKISFSFNKRSKTCIS